MFPSITFLWCVSEKAHLYVNIKKTQDPVLIDRLLGTRLVLSLCESQRRILPRLSFQSAYIETLYQALHGPRTLFFFLHIIKKKVEGRLLTVSKWNIYWFFISHQWIFRNLNPTIHWAFEATGRLTLTPSRPGWVDGLQIKSIKMEENRQRSQKNPVICKW